MRHAERLEELEVLILHVLSRDAPGCGRVVNSQFRSRARARSKPSLTGACANDVTIPALKRTVGARARGGGGHHAKARAPVASELGSGLRKLVGILDGAALVLSPDTGPLHMTVALNRPVISLMGYTNPKRVGPYRRFHDLLIDAYGDPGEDVSALDGEPAGPHGAHQSARRARPRRALANDLRVYLERAEGVADPELAQHAHESCSGSPITAK